jgi:hypothetical protein
MRLKFSKSAISISGCILFGLLAVTSANANQSQVQSLTNFTKNDPTYSDGKLTSCALQFSTIFTDSSLRGRAFFAEGSVGFVFLNGEAMFSPFTKVAVSERLSVAGKISASPLAIQNAVIAGDNGLETAMFESVSLQSPINSLAILTKYRMNDKSNERSFVELATSNAFTVSFNMDRNPTRYEIPVDLTLATISDGKEVHSNEAVLGFTNCLLEMTKQAKRKSEK